ncbi:MAG: 2-phospho-L-lactate transferase [Candidatus Dadabacteria bacterium]|nr:MAG: 2-phospho-L-lactate transferase [Candidatus Dadabacteria bacterium]
MPTSKRRVRVTLLAGGVGAARFLRGLAGLVDPDRLTVIVNTGDDDTFYGLHVSPDLDTIVYTLAGLAPRKRGWGIQGDGHRLEHALATYYGRPWFRIGDRDLATHIYRTDRLGQGIPLSRCTREIAQRLGVRQRILPATDDRLRTYVRTTRGRLAFQQYLVKYGARPRVLGIEYAGARRARPAPGTVEAIERADAVLIAPSNPLVSIRPILAVAPIRRALERARSKTVAVSPLVHGRAVKGPLDRMLRQMGFGATTATIARFYSRYASALIVEPGDGRASAGPAPLRILEHPTVMHGTSSARRLAAFALAAVLEPARSSS